MKTTPSPLPAAALRWECPLEELGFASTAEVEPTPGVVGQELALEALRFGLDCAAPGQNVFVRGQRGTGRQAMVTQLLEEIRPLCRNKLDRCYVHNFLQADRPRLISLPKGQGRVLRRRLRSLADFLAQELEDAMSSKPLQSSRQAIQDRTRARIEALTEPFEKELKAAGLALVQIRTPYGSQPAILPVWEDQPVAPEQFAQLVESGKLEQARHDAIMEQREAFSQRLPELTASIGRIQRRGMRELTEFNEKNLRRLIAELVEPIKQDFNNEALNVYLDEVVDDVVEQSLHGRDANYDPVVRYGVNILLEHLGDESPVVTESNPTLSNLLGTIETQWTAQGRAISDYRGIRAGSLLEADGGFLVLDAHDLLSEPGTWRILMRTLRTGLLEIVPAEFQSPIFPVGIKPEPIPVNVRVILLGSPALYYQLDYYDEDFRELFKVLADFDDLMDRDEQAVWHYASVLSRIARSEGLRHFAASAVAALTEHGARIAGHGGRLSARFGRVADLARESDWLAGREGAELVEREHVLEAVKRTKRRASLPLRRFQSLLKDRTIRVQTEGRCVGQVNGLAVIGAGPLTYGFPARITGTIGAGTAGVIDIEGQASLSGSIHTKGFQILGGLLRYLLRSDHPLTFSASLAFEQSYGGIDGDSASGAEICCMLSALTDTPLRQDLALTGAIDQHGALQAVGGVNEKIEGFFDICEHFGLTGTQGVIIPAANATDLMLRQDVVDACREGRFQVYAVDQITDALGLLTGREIGRWDPEAAAYPAGSLLDIARRRAQVFWRETIRKPKPPAPREDES